MRARVGGDERTSTLAVTDRRNEKVPAAVYNWLRNNLYALVKEAGGDGGAVVGTGEPIERDARDDKYKY